MNRVFATVDLGRLLNNFKSLKNKNGSICVVKADAYGHGANAIASAIDGAFSFAVSSLKEALDIVDVARAPVIILGDGYPSEFYDAIQNNIVVSVGSLENAAKLDAVSRRMKKKARAVLCINTGMNRDGFYFDDIDGIMRTMSLENVDVIGVYTHPPRDEDPAFISIQRDRLRQISKIISSAGKNVFISFENSGICPTGEFISRLGISLYGLVPGGYSCPSVLPIMELKAAVLSLRRVKKGEYIGYGSTFLSKRDMICATIAAGYADGVPYSMSNRGSVIINGKRAPIVGAVCMDMMMVDVTKIQCSLGDIATIIGKDGNEIISFEDVARCADTINYEIPCGISKRVPRIYIGGEK